MNVRMTLKEMQNEYPNRWLGINEIERDDKRRILSANVVYTDKTASELSFMTINHEDIQAFFTTPDDTFHVGVVM